MQPRVESSILVKGSRSLIINKAVQVQRETALQILHYWSRADSAARVRVETDPLLRGGSGLPGPNPSAGCASRRCEKFEHLVLCPSSATSMRSTRTAREALTWLHRSPYSRKSEGGPGRIGPPSARAI